MSIPTPSGPLAAIIAAVSCATSTSCLAVGTSISASFVESAFADRWNGISWSSVAGPTVTGAQSDALSQVECKSATSCVAVGDSGSGPLTPAGAETPLIARWNGTRWLNVPSATPAGAKLAALVGISCSSIGRCAAVGTFANPTSGGDDPLAERWDGTIWSVVPAATRPGPRIAILSGVSCVATDSCLAVGESPSGALSERWNGTSWSIVPSAATTAGQFGSLTAISCASSAACYAVGDDSGANGSVPLAERWNGTTWSVTPIPKPTTGADSLLASVSCSDAADCMAVGSTLKLSITTIDISPLIEHWDGVHWSILAGAVPGGAHEPTLSGVSCPSADDCEAVGSYLGNDGPSALIEHWNGTSWSDSTSPKPAGTLGAQLSAVSCPTVGNCTAVGTTDAFEGQHTIVEHSVADTWSIVASPDAAGQDSNLLTGVSCASPNDCTAIGISQNAASGGVTFVGGSELGNVLTEHWNGIRWTVLPNPAVPNATNVILNAVSSPPDNSCIAVGFLIQPGTGIEQALAEKLN
ncbi:MAG: hypothetical protein ACLPVY_24220 [Acidimicrobiia bacterium]